MMPRRFCEATNRYGEPCRQAPLTDSTTCFWHSPEHADEAAAARRMGGMRRRKEGAVAGAYDFDGIRSTQDLHRLLDIAAYDALAMEGSANRVRLIVSVVQAGGKLLEVGKNEGRLNALEAALQTRRPKKDHT